jgi:hypothetical protein
VFSKQENNVKSSQSVLELSSPMKLLSIAYNGYTQRQIVEELNRIGVKTSRGHEFQLTTLQRVIKRLGLATLHSK